MDTNLSLYILDSNDTKFMRVIDMSCYDTIDPSVDQELLVKAPGFSAFRKYIVKNNFSVLITTINLHKTKSLGDLVDGVYTIKYTLSGDVPVWIEYNHLRTTTILNIYYKVLASLEIDCNLDRDKHEKLRELADIKNYIDAAKIYVEYANACQRGQQLYEYALKKLKFIENKYC